jgi:hypothetical protein
MAEQKPLTSDDLARMQHRADRFSRSIGTVYHEMARDIYRLLAERERLLRELTVSIEKLARHLQETHGIDPTGYTREELLALHDNDHNAPRTNSSRVIRSQSTCPGGTCPTR